MKLSRLNINMRDILFNSFKFVVREKSMRERVFIKNMVFYIYENINTSKIMNKFLPVNNRSYLYLTITWLTKIKVPVVAAVSMVSILLPSTKAQKHTTFSFNNNIIRLWQTNRFLTHISFVKTTSY